jgi:hypothetical protein
MLQVVLSLSGPEVAVSGTGPLCVTSHKKFLVTITCAMVDTVVFTAGGAVAVFVILVAGEGMVVYVVVVVHVVDSLTGIVVMGESQAKLPVGPAVEPRVIAQAIVYGDGNINGTLPVLVNL